MVAVEEEVVVVVGLRTLILIVDDSEGPCLGLLLDLSGEGGIAGVYHFLVRHGFLPGKNPVSRASNLVFLHVSATSPHDEVMNQVALNHSINLSIPSTALPLHLTSPPLLERSATSCHSHDYHRYRYPSIFNQIRLTRLSPNHTMPLWCSRGRRNDLYLDGFLMAQQQQRQYQFMLHQQQRQDFMLQQQMFHHHHLMYLRRRYLSAMLLDQHQQRVQDTLHTIYQAQHRGRLGGHFGSTHDFLQDLVGGRLMLTEEGEFVPRSSDDLPFPPGGRIRSKRAKDDAA